MSGDERNSDPSEAPVVETTEETAAFVDAVPPDALDPWTDLTPGFPDADEDDDAPVVDATEAWVEIDAPPEIEPEPVEAFRGDGPFAAPVDRPPRPVVSTFMDELQAASPAFDRPLVVERRPPPPRPAKARRSASVARGAAAAPKVAPDDPPARHYPMMRALLKDPEGVPTGSAPIHAPAPPAVPGTFFPAPREPMEMPPPADLDGLLSTMAEGLLIGESAEGHTEIRVTLKDEFFAGTELRITLGDRGLTALLVPPDRDIYWQLDANLEDLKTRLIGRGLSVEDIRIADP